jgi:hypothetical protein
MTLQKTHAEILPVDARAAGVNYYNRPLTRDMKALLNSVDIDDMMSGAEGISR